MTSTFTGASVSRIDIEPVSIEALACASSVGLRPSQPTGASPAWPSPISGCDLRDVSLPESLRLFASVTPQPSAGKWQLAHAVVPEAESRGSKNSARPSPTRAAFSTGRGGGRRYSCRSVARSSGERAWAATPAVVPTTPATAKPTAAASRRPDRRSAIGLIAPAANGRSHGNLHRRWPPSHIAPSRGRSSRPRRSAAARRLRRRLPTSPPPGPRKSPARSDPRGAKFTEGIRGSRRDWGNPTASAPIQPSMKKRVPALSDR